MPVAHDEADLHACDDHAWLADLHAMRQAMIHVGDLGSAVLGIAVELNFLIAVGRESQLLADCRSTNQPARMTAWARTADIQSHGSPVLVAMTQKPLMM